MENLINTSEIKKICLVALIALTSSCSWFESKNKQNDDNHNKLKLVNVLDASMFAVGHIKDSINIPFDKLKQEAARLKQANIWHDDTPIVVYCTNYACMASLESVKQLKKLGFKDVCAYEGGMAEWYALSKKDSSYQIEGSSPEFYATLNVDKPDDEQETDVCVISAEKLHEKLAPADKLR